MKTVAVFFGGKSNEHEISIITGMFAVNLLRGGGYKVLPVYLPRGGGMTLANVQSVEEFRIPDDIKLTPVILFGRELVHAKKKKKVAEIDCALNCCHGGAGEDGTLSALLKWNGVPLASPDTPVSAIFMNKEYSQIAARGLGIPVAPSISVREGEKDVKERAQALSYPVIVKPSRLGSSIGVKVAENEEELTRALELAFTLDDGALVEAYFPEKRDVNCAACRLNGEICVSDCEEVFSDGKILSFSEKYEGTATRKSQFPADLPEALSAQIKEYTRTLYETFRIRGVVRADFLVADGKAYFNELNTVPGSLACYLFGAGLSKARAFLCGLVREALAFPEEEKQTLTTGILNQSVFSCGKGCKRSGNLV